MLKFVLLTPKAYYMDYTMTTHLLCLSDLSSRQYALNSVCNHHKKHLVHQHGNQGTSDFYLILI